MDEFEHPLQQQGRYRLVALSRQPLYAAAHVRGYLVTNLAGDRLREEATQARALQWIDAHVAADAAPDDAPPRARRR